MPIGKGIFIEKIGEQEVGFKFGMYASAISSEVAGCNIYELFKRIADPAKTELAFIQYFYGGAVAYCEKHGKQKPNIDQVADWIEELGERAVKIYNDSLPKPDAEKNMSPPPDQNLSGG